MKTRPPLASKHLELIALTGIPNIAPGDDLGVLITASMTAMQIELLPGDILVIAQKIVSKAEDRLVRIETVLPSQKSIELAAITGKDPRIVQLILEESVDIIRARRGFMIVEHRLGMIHANAGIDQSNLSDNENDQWALLLPLDPDASAEKIRAGLQKKNNGINIGVMISDSMGRAWRIGTVCHAIGTAGIDVLHDHIGTTDLYGRVLENTLIAFADQLAAAAGLLLGETRDGTPVVLVRGLDASANPQPAKMLLRPEKEDVFR